MRTIADLKVGTKLEKIKNRPEYGVYSDMIVSEIKETKTGRLLIHYKYTFTNTKGDSKKGIEGISHQAIKSNTELSLYNLKSIN